MTEALAELHKHQSTRRGGGLYSSFTSSSHLLPCSLYEASEIYLNRFKENVGRVLLAKEKKKIWSSILGPPLSALALSPHLLSLSN